MITIHSDNITIEQEYRAVRLIVESLVFNVIEGINQSNIVCEFKCWQGVKENEMFIKVTPYHIIISDKTFGYLKN